MLGTFLDKLGGLFDRRFIVACWGPLFIGFGLIGGLIVGELGPSVFFIWWERLSVEEQVVLGVGSLLTITLLAYMLDALTAPLIRFYEGYWSWKWFTRLLTGWQKAQKAKLADSAHSYGFTRFPRNSALLKPTRLGNVLVAAEECPYQLYRLDAVIWWPRLVTLLPERLRSQLDTALMPLMALLNLCMIFTLLALGGGATVLLTDKCWWLGVPVIIGGLVLARACYLAATNQAMDYGQLIRVAYDLYRHDILKQMHMPMPDNLVEERLLWDTLNTMMYNYIPPWEREAAIQTPRLAHPFYYDTHPTPPTLTPQQTITPTSEASLSSETIQR
jgi:hypothetical protein